MAAPHVAGVAALYLDEDSTRTPAQIDALLGSRSTKDKVTDVKSGSPNELLYSLVGDGGPVDPVDPDPVLEDGVAVSISGATGTENFYTFEVPANTAGVSFSISGGSGDADLYVQQGTKPTQSSYSCRPYKNGNEETCTFNNPAAGTWHVMVRGYSAYSGVSLVAQTSSGGGCGANCLDNGVPVTGLSGARNSEVMYTVDVPAGVTLNVNTSGGSGDADLYVRQGVAPTTSTYDCRPYQNGNNENCSLNSGTGGTYYIMLRGYSAYSGVTLQASY
jgi:serine protease